MKKLFFLISIGSMGVVPVFSTTSHALSGNTVSNGKEVVKKEHRTFLERVRTGAAVAALGALIPLAFAIDCFVILDNFTRDNNRSLYVIALNNGGQLPQIYYVKRATAQMVLLFGLITVSGTLIYYLLQPFVRADASMPQKDS